jgi:branched-chain amino acid transport system substrate-binding protein
MSRSTFRGAIALVVGLTLASCGGVASDTTTTTVADISSTTAAAETTTAPAAETTTSATQQDLEPVRIGFIVPRSGVYSVIGEDIERGLETYLTLNGETLGGRPVEIIAVDEGDSAQTGTAAARRLIDQEQVVGVVGTINTATALAIAPLFAEAGIPVISSAEVHEQPHWFMAGWTNPMMNDSMVDHLSSTLSDDASVYLIASDYAQGHSILEGVGTGLEAADVTVAGTTFTPFGSTEDYQPYLSEIIGSDATTVYAFYAGGEAIRFVTQYAAFGLPEQADLYGNQALTEGVLAAQGANAVGVQTNSTYAATIDSPLNQAFVESYVSAFEATPSVYSEVLFAAMTILNDAVATISDPVVEGPALRDAIAGLGDLETPRGIWRLDENQGPEQTIWLREAIEQDGQYINQVTDSLGVYSSGGERLGD